VPLLMTSKERMAVCSRSRVSCASAPRRSLASRSYRDVAVAFEGCHGASDGNVQAAVEDLKLLRADLGVDLAGELGDDLAHVAVTVDHLGDGESKLEQIRSVKVRAVEDARARDRAGAATRNQRFDELRQKQRHAVLDVGLAGLRRSSLAHPGARAIDDRLAVRGDELMEHDEPVRSS
jgi:hypothetical protein